MGNSSRDESPGNPSVPFSLQGVRPMMLHRTRGAVVLGLACLTVAVVSGCARLELHATVKPDASTDMAVQARVAMPLAFLINQAMGARGLGGQSILPDLKVTERDEGVDHVWELSLPGTVLTTTGLCQVTAEQRALGTHYCLVIDPQRLNPLASAMTEQPGVRPASAVLSGREWQVAPALETQLPGDLADKLGQLKDMLGALGILKPENMSPEGLMKELQPAFYAHMPGRLIETNGERVDEWTARWQFDPASLGQGLAAMTARSELPDAKTLEGLAGRLGAHLQREVDPVALTELVFRRLLPDPVVEVRNQAQLDVHIYGTMFTLVSGLDEIVGPEKSDAVVKALGLTGDEPDLWLATRAAKRLPELRESERPAEMSVEDLARLLHGPEA